MPLLREALTEFEYLKVARWWDDFLADKRMRNGHPSLRHGDFWHGNILVDPSSGRLTGVIDWEKAAIADPAEDLATLRHLTGGLADSVLRAYQKESGVVHPDLVYRTDRYWELREFGGVLGAVEMNDQAEFAESIQKLRQGPILGSAGSK
jgi:aminoglycoside phosphotransferase (APT) family kinase protein